jgi:hypothetical protein
MRPGLSPGNPARRGLIFSSDSPDLSGAFDVDLWYDETRTRAVTALIVVDDSEVRYEHF